MDDMHDEDETARPESSRAAEREPADWVNAELLDVELWNAIAEDFSGSSDDAEYEDIDDILDPEEEFADEDEQRRCTFRLLAEIRLQLAELLQKA